MAISKPYELDKKFGQGGGAGLDAGISGGMVTNFGETVRDEDERIEQERRVEPQVAAGSGGGGGGGGGGKAQAFTPRTPNRMGIGPGGPAMGFDDAMTMLNAPTNIGDVQSSMQTARTGGVQQLSQFKQAAGGPVQYGQEDRDTISAALAPQAEGQEHQQRQEYDAARDLISKTYTGPSQMGEKTDDRQIFSPYQKARRTAEEGMYAAEGLGQGGLRAAMNVQQGMKPGPARYEAAKDLAEPGVALAARKTAAEGADIHATLADQLKQSQEIAGMRAGETLAVRQEAKGDIEGRRTGIREGAETLAEEQVEDIRGKNKAYEEVMSGEAGIESLQEFAPIAALTGESLRGRTKAAYEGIQNDPRFASIKGVGTFVLKSHYTGQKMLDVTPDMKEHFRQKYPNIGSNVWNHMLRHGGSSRPGRWLFNLMRQAAVAIPVGLDGSINEGAIVEGGELAYHPDGRPVMRGAYRRTGGGGQGGNRLTPIMRPEEIDGRPTGRRERGGLVMEQVQYHARSPAYDRTGADARRMVKDVSLMYERHQRFEGHFAGALPALATSGQDWQRGIQQPGQIRPRLAPEGQWADATADEFYGRGGYFSGFMRPRAGQGAAPLSHILPMYGGRSIVSELPSLMDKDETGRGRYLSAPTGTPTWLNTLTEDQQFAYNTGGELLGLRDQVERDEAIDTGFRSDISALSEDQSEMEALARTESRRIALAQASLGRGLRSGFYRAYDDADSMTNDINEFLGEDDTGSASGLKRLPIRYRGGAFGQGPLPEDYFEQAVG